MLYCWSLLVPNVCLLFYLFLAFLDIQIFKILMHPLHVTSVSLSSGVLFTFVLPSCIILVLLLITLSLLLNYYISYVATYIFFFECVLFPYSLCFIHFFNLCKVYKFTCVFTYAITYMIYMLHTEHVFIRLILYIIDIIRLYCACKISWERQ